MNKQEIKIMQEFKILKKQMEDISLEPVHEELYSFFDRIGNEKLQSVEKAAKDLMKTMDKIIDFNTAIRVSDEYSMNYKAINQVFDEVMDYFSRKNGLGNEIQEIMSPKLTPIAEKIENLIVGSYFYGYQRVANNMKFNFIKTKNAILNEIVKDPGSTFKVYRDLICEVIDKVNERIDINLKNILSYIEKAEKKGNIDSEKRNLQKIINCRKMDKYLSKNGYKPIRQNGSHKIYDNGINKIPVPQHSSLNKSLGYEIQREMKQDI